MIRLLKSILKDSPKATMPGWPFSGMGTLFLADLLGVGELVAGIDTATLAAKMNKIFDRQTQCIHEAGKRTQMLFTSETAEQLSERVSANPVGFIKGASGKEVQAFEFTVRSIVAP